MAEFPEDLHYSDEHEWVRAGNGDTVRIGITDYAAEQLGDVVHVQLPEPGEQVAAGDSVGELESTKSVSDVFCPAAGVITVVNETLADSPELVTSDPYGDGWIFELQLTDAEALDDLMDAEAYASFTDS